MNEEEIIFPPEFAIYNPPPRHCDSLQLKLSMRILFKLKDDLDLNIIALKAELNIYVLPAAANTLFSFELTNFVFVKFESLIVIMEAEETRKPELENSL